MKSVSEALAASRAALARNGRPVPPDPGSALARAIPDDTARLRAGRMAARGDVQPFALARAAEAGGLVCRDLALDGPEGQETVRVAVRCRLALLRSREVITEVQQRAGERYREDWEVRLRVIDAPGYVGCSMFRWVGGSKGRAPDDVVGWRLDAAERARRGRDVLVAMSAAEVVHGVAIDGVRLADALPFRLGWTGDGDGGNGQRLSLRSREGRARVLLLRGLSALAELYGIDTGCANR
jgi:hypothetical protein